MSRYSRVYLLSNIYWSKKYKLDLALDYFIADKMLSKASVSFTGRCPLSPISNAVTLVVCVEMSVIQFAY